MLTKKNVLVTGANRGIGLATCKALLEKNFYVIMGVRDLEKGQKSLEQLGSKNIELVKLDTSDIASCDKAVAEIFKRHERLDVLVNNAGVYLDEATTLKELEMKIFTDTMQTNLYGPLHLCQLILPKMEEYRYGRIVNISSQYGSLESMKERGVGSYKISKLALNGMTQILAKEVNPKYIKINSLCPGWVKTDMGGAGAGRSPETAAKGVVWAAMLPEDGPSGGFFRDATAIDW
ncbi:MAG: SDR family NAD(P)-dependent oxidoreductase [Bacteriovoracaceae bacterium]|nr:SDR family NAD(P)-dependent oxidoreductase [Bacteriovoracaceae bacterium]